MHRNAKVPVRFDGLGDRPPELAASLTRTCQAVVARVMIAFLAVGIPLVAPVLTHRALATIDADHASRVTARVVHQADRPEAWRGRSKSVTSR